MRERAWQVIAVILVAYLFLAPWIAVGAFALGMHAWGIAILVWWVALIVYVIHRAS